MHDVLPRTEDLAGSNPHGNGRVDMIEPNGVVLAVN